MCFNALQAVFLPYVSVEEDTVFDFKGLRLDWFRFQVKQFQSLSYSKQKKKHCVVTHVIRAGIHIDGAISDAPQQTRGPRTSHKHARFPHKDGGHAGWDVDGNVRSFRLLVRNPPSS